jgi:hypothetical protein
LTDRETAGKRSKDEEKCGNKRDKKRLIVVDVVLFLGLRGTRFPFGVAGNSV